eukprot:7481137-Alexandrium_andersonii.AAC.1
MSRGLRARVFQRASEGGLQARGFQRASEGGLRARGLPEGFGGSLGGLCGAAESVIRVRQASGDVRRAPGS